MGEEEQSAQESDSEDGCEMEQVPVGVENIVCNRGNKKLEGQVLVFTNPETDLVPTNINELDSCDLDDETDPNYNPQDAIETNTNEEEEENASSETDSIDHEDLDGVTEHHKIQTDERKLVFPDVVAARQVVIASDDEEEEANMNEKEYIEEEDGEAEEEPAVINLEDDIIMMKIDPMTIPPPAVEEVDVVAAEMPMDCE